MWSQGKEQGPKAQKLQGDGFRLNIKVNCHDSQRPRRYELFQKAVSSPLLEGIKQRLLFAFERHSGRVWRTDQWSFKVSSKAKIPQDSCCVPGIWKIED